MKKFYIHNGSEQQGPFDIADLKAKNITTQTPIWYEGLSEWSVAGKINELNDLFSKSTPPPFKAKITPPPIKKESISYGKSFNKIRIGVAVILLIIASIGIGAYMNNNNSSGSNYQENYSSDEPSYSTNDNSESENYNTNNEVPQKKETYKQRVRSVEEIELSQPTKFLSADGKYNENFLGDKIKVHGVIHNTATVAWYKDAVVRVTYYSKTQTVLGTNDYTIYDEFSPQSDTKFELKIENYSNVGSIGWDVLQATPN